MRGTGERKDKGKPPLASLPFVGLAGAAQVFEWGKDKYDDWQWANGMAWSRVVGSMLRHLMKMQMGQEFDEESGLPHVDHMLSNAMILASLYRLYPEGNDFGSHLLDPSAGSKPVKKKEKRHSTKRGNRNGKAISVKDGA